MVNWKKELSEMWDLGEFDYQSPNTLWEAIKLLEEIEENKSTIVPEIYSEISNNSWNILKILEIKGKSIYDIPNYIEWLSWKHIVLWQVEDNFFISLTWNVWNYNKEYDFKFKWKSNDEVIEKFNKELEKYNYEVPVESDDWR